VAGGAAFAHGSCSNTCGRACSRWHCAQSWFTRPTCISFGLRSLRHAIVAGRATHPPFLDRMMELEAKLGVLVEVALEAGVGTLAGINDQLALAPESSVNCQAHGNSRSLHPPPAAFAGNLDAGVLCELEVFHFLLMTCGTRCPSRRTWHQRSSAGQNHPIHCRTRDGDDRHRQAADQASESFHP